MSSTNSSVKDANPLYTDYIDSLNKHSQCLENHLEKIKDHYLVNKVYVDTDIQAHCVQSREKVLLARTNLKGQN